MQSFKRTIATRALAWVLAFVMVFTMIPYGAFAQGEPKPETPPTDTCLSQKDLQEQFEKAANGMFDGIGTKEGVYEATYDAGKREVTVKILDKDKKATALSGTGLISGLVKLYKNNHLAKVQIGTGQVLELAKLEKAAPSSGMTFEQMLKLTIGADLLNEVQDPDNQTGNLSDFIDKTVELHVTLHQEGCGEAGDVNLIYTINGVDGTQSAEPTIIEPKAGDTSVSGTGVPGATVVLKDKDGNTIGEATVGEDGKWTVDNIPVDKLVEGEKVTAEQKEPGKKPASKDATIAAKPAEPQPGDDATTVDDKNVNPVKPTDKPQDTGIDVKNPDKDTKVSAKDEDGKDVPAKIEDGNVIVKPGKDVDGPITVTITDPDLDKPVVIEVPVNGHKKGRDDNSSDKGNSGGYWFIPSTPSKTDDKPKHETAIHKLYIYGYEDSTFRPEGNMTRAEAAAMLARLQGLDLSNKARPNFIDVRSGWYNAAINAVVDAGYMKGYPDGTFRPDGKITRAEFAQMIKAIDKANRGAAPFADVKGHWAENAINQAYVNGRIAGYPDETFRPNNHITRAEAVTVFNKLYDRSVNFTGLSDVATAIAPFKDVAGNHWAYYEIIESSNTHEFYRTEAGKVDETWVRLVQSWKQALANR